MCVDKGEVEEMDNFLRTILNNQAVMKWKIESLDFSGYVLFSCSIDN